MKTFMLELLKQYAKQYAKDKTTWVALAYFVFAGLNKWIGLGLDETVVNGLAVGVGGYLVAHVLKTKPVIKG